MTEKYILLPLFDVVENISEIPEPNNDVAFWESDYRNGLAFLISYRRYCSRKALLKLCVMGEIKYCHGVNFAEMIITSTGIPGYNLIFLGKRDNSS